MSATIQHTHWCQPPAGEPGPRIESFLAERTNDAGVVTSRPRVVRCLDCGEQTVEG